MRKICKHCAHCKVCKKSNNIENYSLKGECSDFDPKIEIIIQNIFEEIEVAMDNRSTCSHTLDSGSLQPCIVYDSDLSIDFETIKSKYLGGYYA